MSTSVKIWIAVLAFGLAASIFLVYVAARPPTTQALGFIGVLLLAIGQPQMWRLMAEHPEWQNSRQSIQSGEMRSRCSGWRS